MIENEFFNEVKKRKVEYQQKLNDVTLLTEKQIT